ncbi:antibiotic biosynthesis monooxygenase [Vibrio sp. ZSDZ34]|jgi:heme-degrading monooxygenase HmoA|uniref:Antibiotic biosynthesis monooxygenase n=1 Tax=Vibrio gelatinilyticus TaxID=2893468 RepID=A0A9X2AVB0_9VIBR|nr:antibiotic biosynthesis monooxygenase [Vibrio gelatinilyticus]MCJ2376704.1 antibiotic biosynthesis monooxygenase [Vibrio gelatinilyticus]
MYAVIFKATIKQLDSEYLELAASMRDRAFSLYNCVDFVATTEGDQEVAVSYWKSKEDIKAWHDDEQHQAVQRLGKLKWYSSYSVDVVKVERSYTSESNN